MMPWPAFLYLLAYFMVAALWINYKGGVTRNLLFCYCLALYFILLFYTPLCSYLYDINTIHGTFFGNYYGWGLLIYGLGLGFFILGYISFGDKKWHWQAIGSFKLSVKWLEILFWGTWLLVFINLILNGFDPIAYFDSSQKSQHLDLSDNTGISIYLQDLPDTVAALLIIMLCYTKFPRTRWLVYTLLSCLIFFAIGWRYRILIILLAAIMRLILLSHNKWKALAQAGHYSRCERCSH